MPKARIKQKKSRLDWYLSRIRTMSPPEIVYRVRTALKKKWDQRSKMSHLPKGSIDRLPGTLFFLPKTEREITLRDYSIFGHGLNYRKSIDWHRDLTTRKEFPRKFSFDIDTRSGKNGNVKVVWEVNRLQYLLHICLKYQQSKEKKYLDLFVRHIEEWKEANPYLNGVNWYSNIEVNIRIINWVFCWEMIEANELMASDSEFKKFVETTWLPLIELHARHAYRYESKYSSSNNHLIAEASGLFIAGCYWSFKDSDRHIKKGQAILEEEIVKQHSANGINKEEASEYIQFITDFFLIAFLIGERSGHGFSEAYRQTLQSIFDYIYHLMDMGGNVPYYGDDDDGKVISLPTDETHFNNFRSLLTSAAIVFNDPKFKAKGRVFDLKNQVLFGEEGQGVFDSLALPEKTEPETRLYKNEGHFLIKKGGDAREVYLHVDIAPLGYLSIAAHGHADALSFFLNIDGKPYIVDPGTYTYHSFPEWRAYFKGTLAHNTIRVDGLDQSVNGGPCLWLNHYQAEVLEIKDSPEEIVLKGSHNGYDQQGVKHTRTYIFDKKNDSITIIDDLKVANDETHVYEYPLHLHPDVTVQQEAPDRFTIAHPGERTVSILLDERLKTEVLRGSESPLLGWFSPSFLQKQPTSVIYSKIELTGNLQLTTKIKVSHEK
ncbi:alginate lyase family protein [Pseudozobellia thermophila]|uniref:Heparinase II/III N-terminus n=1 Tax=Pseudozobellia thermophila TaxID=192903 RepID=A0A1M6KPH9_9FLAO|nr:alginate lyase family protein [Pseudozobellia thermophila]SHJ60898.1 Heparinase II/III N-terminus [Pseudozobellia thermophila]